MKIAGKITWDFTGFNEKIYKEIRRYFKSPVVKLQFAFFEEFLRELVKESIKKSDTWNSLQNYNEWWSLASQLGLSPDTIDERLDAILNIWMKEVHAKFTISNSNTDFYILLTIKAINQGYQNVLNSDQAWYYSESSTPGSYRTYRIDWLKWILTDGNSIKIDDYKIKPTTSKNAERSRSGLSLMAKIPGVYWTMPKDWRVPERYNFLTKVFESEYFNTRLYNMINNLLKSL